MGECCKFEREVFEKFFVFCGVDVVDVLECVFFEDLFKNLCVVKEIFGMTIVFVVGETFYEETRDAKIDVVDVVLFYVDFVLFYVDFVVYGGELIECVVFCVLCDVSSVARCRVAFGLDV